MRAALRAMSDYEAKELARLRAKLDDSALFVSLVSEAYLRDASCLLQLGMAVALDKPIYLAVKRGTVIPENFRRLARAIEEFASAEDVEYATKRLIEAARTAGVLGDPPKER